MKRIIFILIGVALFIISCDRNEVNNSYNATVIGKGLDCGNSYLIKFNNDVVGLPANTTENTFYGINLPEEFKVAGKKIKVEFREPTEEELIVCTTMGISYPQIYILNYPIDKEISDYSLTGSSCTWKSVEKNTLYIIKSAEELANYISCSESNPPLIDFDKHSLLLVQGINLSGIQSIDKQLQQISTNEYRLTVNIVSNETTVVQGWTVAILTPVLPPNTVATLAIRQQ
jgi:hypothetical protein